MPLNRATATLLATATAVVLAGPFGPAAASVVPEPVFVQDAGATDGVLTVSPAATELPDGPGVWRLDVTNGGDVTVTLGLSVTLAVPDDAGAPAPGDAVDWLAAPAADVVLAAGEVAQFGVAVEPPDGAGDVLLARLTSLDTEPEVTVDAVAVVGAFSTAGVTPSFDDGDATTVTLTSVDGRPALADVEARRRTGLFGLGSTTVARLTDVVVLGDVPRTLDLGARTDGEVTDGEAPVDEVTVTSAGATVSATRPGAAALDARQAGIAGAAALLGGGTVIWLRRRSRGQAPSAPASPS